MTLTIQEKDYEPQAAYSRTISGRYVNLLEPNPDEILVSDLCHGMSLTNRFGGHTHQPYSVLQHSLLVSRLVERRHDDIDLTRAALFHDSTEGLVQDLNGMLKKVDELAGYREVENRLARAIEVRLGLAPMAMADPRIKQADKDAFDFECAFIRDSISFASPSPDTVRREFKARFFELFPTVGAW